MLILVVVLIRYGFEDLSNTKLVIINVDLVAIRVRREKGSSLATAFGSLGRRRRQRSTLSLVRCVENRGIQPHLDEWLGTSAYILLIVDGVTPP